MKRIVIFCGVAGLLALGMAVTAACSRKSEYHQIVERELESGVRNDSLFLGLYLGMPSKEFFTHCKQLNQQQLVKEGMGLSVQYIVPGLQHDATMEFFPEFYNNQISEMWATFRYDAWAPWNKQFFSDSLQVDVLSLMEDWYGKGFLKIEHPEKGVAFVKVDGNRRITIYKLDFMKVKVLFTDLLIEKEMKERGIDLVNKE